MRSGAMCQGVHGGTRVHDDNGLVGERGVHGSGSMHGHHAAGKPQLCRIRWAVFGLITLCVRPHHALSRSVTPVTCSPEDVQGQVEEVWGAPALPAASSTTHAGA
eukprot:358897-Chlamydomonas_euryale.AAC.3